MFVSMGEFVKAVGLSGEAKFLPDGDFLEAVLESHYLRRRRGDDEPRSTRIESMRTKGSTWILKLEGIEDRDAAEALVGETLGFVAEDYDRPDFPRPAEPHPFVYHGLRVETVEGEKVGVVEGVLVLPANLVLEVVDGEREHLIPVIPPVIRRLDRQEGLLVIEPMPGLLDDGEDNGS